MPSTVDAEEIRRHSGAVEPLSPSLPKKGVFRFQIGIELPATKQHQELSAEFSQRVHRRQSSVLSRQLSALSYQLKH